MLVAPEAEQGWLKSAEWTLSVAGWEKSAEVRWRELAPLLEWVLELKEEPWREAEGSQEPPLLEQDAVEG